jgi:Mce-associated membrane protein
MPIKTRATAEESVAHHDHTGELPKLDASECRDAPKGGDTTSEEAESEETQVCNPEAATKRMRWSRAFAFGIVPALALLLALAGGYLKWEDSSTRDAQLAGREATQVAKDGTVALLSYRPDTVEKDLGGAQDRLTGTFRDSYTSLTHDVVIPGAKQKQISAVATVPAAAMVSATQNHAVVLVFVNQTIIVGSDPPSSTASSVKVTLDRIGGRWLISGFEPV